MGCFEEVLWFVGVENLRVVLGTAWLYMVTSLIG